MTQSGLERRRQRLLPWPAFLARVAKYAAGAAGLILGALGIGMLGYHQLEDLPWIDSFLNASMILGGMGPVAQLHTDSGKLFAGIYALFAGLIFLVVAGLIFTPLVHRLLHHFHLDGDSESRTQR
jgi:hypothetical protein